MNTSLHKRARQKTSIPRISLRAHEVDNAFGAVVSGGGGRERAPLKFLLNLNSQLNLNFTPDFPIV